MILTRTTSSPDVASVTVSNVIRTDTGATLLPGPAAMAAEGGGEYVYDLPSPAPGLTYRFTWRETRTDGTWIQDVAEQSDEGAEGVITRRILGTIPITSVVIQRIYRTDTGATLVAGPLNMTYQGGGLWIYPFMPTPAGIGYSYEYRVNRADGSWTDDVKAVPGTAGVSGTYTTQALIEAIGQQDADEWSQINNDTRGPNVPRFASAIASTEALFNRRFREAGYLTPIATTSVDFPWIQELATKYALTELYFVPRGMRDATDQVGGQLANLRQWVLDELESLIQNGLDAGRQTGELETGPAALDTYDAYGRQTDSSGRPLQVTTPLLVSGFGRWGRTW